LSERQALRQDTDTTAAPRPERRLPERRPPERKQKRMGKDDAPAREAFIAAAENLLQREGYAALSARRVAEEAGLTKQLLYYYFANMDELVSEMFNRTVQGFTDSLAATFAAEDPLHALWKLHSDTDSRLFTEYMAMANRNETLRAQVLKAHEQNTAKQIAALTALLHRRGIGPEIVTPETLLFLIISAARNLILEKELGIHHGAGTLEIGLDRYFQLLALPGAAAAGAPAAAPLFPPDPVEPDAC